MLAIRGTTNVAVLGEVTPDMLLRRGAGGGGADSDCLQWSDLRRSGFMKSDGGEFD